MKILSNIFAVLLLAVFMTGCGLDNYDAPKSQLKGQIAYQGKPLNVRGTGGAVQLQLYQDGYQKTDPITVYVGQDGKFAAMLFDGQYKLKTRSGNGPWQAMEQPMIIDVKGGATVDLELTPYFTITDEKLTVTPDTYTATFNVNKIVAGAEISRVSLLLSKTQFCDEQNNVLRKDFTQVSPGTVTQTVALTGNANVSGAKALFARVGVLAKGADQAIYTPVLRIR